MVLLKIDSLIGLSRCFYHLSPIPMLGWLSIIQLPGTTQQNLNPDVQVSPLFYALVDIVEHIQQILPHFHLEDICHFIDFSKSPISFLFLPLKFQTNCISNIRDDNKSWLAVRGNTDCFKNRFPFDVSEQTCQRMQIPIVRLLQRLNVLRSVISPHNHRKQVCFHKDKV